MGQGSLDAMILAGLISFALIAVYMLVLYRLPGFVAVIGLIGQVAGSLAAVSGWFSFMHSSTLTIPGIAGIILAVVLTLILLHQKELKRKSIRARALILL